MTHYLEDFKELLPAPSDKEATIADNFKRAECPFALMENTSCYMNGRIHSPA